MEIRSRRKRRGAEINIVPMIDVFTALIFFFLLTMQFKSVNAADITPPKMESSSAVSGGNVANISISRDGAYFIDAKPASIADVENFLEEISVKGEKQPIVLLSADASAKLESVTNVVDMARKIKIRRLSIQAVK